MKPPFDPSRAKGTAYQTGVWVPLVVAGPLVNQPDRDVTHMVNIADLFQLFGEIAGIDVRGERPAADRFGRRCCRTSSTRRRRSIRTWNFTQVGAEPAGQRQHQRAVHDRELLHARSP